jgi:hypothetical protein
MTYRGTGADAPFGDPRRAHPGVAMEGYFWRFTDVASGRVVIALCGINRGAAGSWATVALAGHPSGFLAQAAVPGAAADDRALGALAGAGAFRASADRVQLDLGADARLDVRLTDTRPWPRRAFGGLGAAHAIPGLSQYWHPHLLGGRARGRATLGGETIDLDGFAVYAEKNWGRGGFPQRWWWGQAQGFERDDVCVAFAGGLVGLGALRGPQLSATALVIRVGDTLVRLGQPLLSGVRADVRPGAWELRGRGPVWSAEVTATARPGTEHLLPVPLPDQRRNVAAAHQHLAGQLHVVLRRRGRVVFAGSSALAGLEQGDLTTALAETTGASAPTQA